jgi:hypothetical protein
MVYFTGIASVSDRTLFTNRGPIVKRPLPLLVGSDLRVLSENQVQISSGNFSEDDVGRLVTVSGTEGGRNDGTFRIQSVVTSKVLVLADSSFSVLDEDATTDSVVTLANDIKLQYGLHRSRKVLVDGVLEGVHGMDDGTNVVTADGCHDLASAIILANDLLAKYNAHAHDVSGDPKVHIEIDFQDLVALGPSSNLSQVLNLLNELRRKYESHRQNHFVHQNVDLIDRVDSPPVKPATNVYPGPLTGPFPWTILDPRYGQPADSPYDVSVTVNGQPAGVDAVFGLMGAVVLSSKPTWSDTISIDYDFVENPPSRFMRLNSPEFTLNQYGNTALAGVPKHRYRSSSHLITGAEGVPLSAPFKPFKRGWKYKAYERAYTASLNDPTTLLLNVPTNKLTYPVLFERVTEVTIRYDPTTLPQNALDPWTQEGRGTLTLAPGGSALTVVDSSTQSGVDSKPPFFTHAINLDAESSISAAFRARMSSDPAVFVPDGVFSGVSFGVSDGRKISVVGFILTQATNLTSAIVMANSLKAQLNGHVVNVGSHFPDDPSDEVDFVDASGLPELLVLVNAVRTSYSEHAAKGGGVGLIHRAADSANAVTLPAATDLPSAVALANQLRLLLNAHGTQPGVHFTNDASHQVPLVRQVGVLTSRGFPELEGSWNAFAADWTGYQTYRLARDPSGGVGVYVSGSVAPSASVARADLPDTSSVDAEFDVIQQVYFGSIGRESKSSSDWQFVRVNVQPVDANLIENNKQVDYQASTTPELDPDAPWITYGQAGIERVLTPGLLLVDSTASASAADMPQLGLVPGAYRGYVRYEPILSTDNALVAEFRMGADYWTSSVSDRAFGLFMADPDFSVQLAFLQSSPTPAVTTGTVADPFVLVNGDTLIVQIGSEPVITVSFLIPPGTNTAASVAARINSVLGFPFASAASGHVTLSSSDLGVSATFSILSGSSLAKLGLSPGKYFGSDSSPEPKMSWFGANLPELDDPTWVKSGGQSASLFNRVLRAVDVSTSDYIAWTLEDPLVTNQVLGNGADWKLDVRLSVLSFSPGPTITTTSPYQDLDFAGALVSVDEGPSGKNVELHLAVAPSGAQYLNLLTYDFSSGTLVVMAQYAFAWNDGGVHTLNVYTSKSVNSLMVLADGVVLSPSVGPAPTYHGLSAGVSGPSLSFGSGGEPVTGSDIRACRSVVDWYSVAAFADSKISDSLSASRRFIGIYRGGPPDVLSSYYLHQVDWAPLHTYRVMRDPSAGLQVYLDGSATPAIAVPYDVLTLPPSESSFLFSAARGRPFVAFGAFSPTELSRTRWDFLRYSVGKITLTDLLIPPNQVLNQANVIASPDHLRTQKSHQHQGFTVYSGGSPIDEFMSDKDVQAVTILGDGTPPVPATQDLEVRHGMVKVGTPLDTISAVNAVSFAGFTTDLVDDDVNVSESSAVPVAGAVTGLNALLNAIRSAYESHRVYPGVHPVNDTVDFITAPPATGLPSAIALANDIKAKLNAHYVLYGTHIPSDIVDLVEADDATDVSSAAILANAILESYSSHIGKGSYHIVPDLVDTIATDFTIFDLTTAALGASVIADAFSSHSLSTSYHDSADSTNGKFSNPVLPGVGKAGVTGLSALATSDSLDVGQLVSFLDGPNAGQSRVVVAKISSSQYQVVPDFLLNDSGLSRYVHFGRSTVTSAFATSGLGYSIIDVTGSAVTPAVGDEIMFLGGPNYGQIRSVTALSGSQFRVTPVLLASDPTSWPMTYISKPSVPGVDPNYVIGLSNSLMDRYRAHLTAPGVHRTTDVTDFVPNSPAVVLDEAVLILNQLRSEINPHLVGFWYHLIEDMVNVVTTLPAIDPLAASISTLNSVKNAYLHHVFQSRVHLQDDDSNLLLPPLAHDLDSAIFLANSLKETVNRHLSAVVHEVVGPLVQKVHSMDDTANVITSADATDLISLCTLSVDVADSYNAHRVQPGVHGSTLLVRLEAPTRVLYEGIRFWTSDEGDSLARMAPFSDDETLRFSGPITQTGTTSYSFQGSHLPEDDILVRAIALANDLKATYNSHLVQSGVHLLNDTINGVTSPDATDLASVENLLTEMKSRYNLHISQPGVHIEDDTRDAIVASDPTALAMVDSLVSELRTKYGIHRLGTAYHPTADVVNVVTQPAPQPYGDGWVLVASRPDAVSVTLVASPETAVRVATLSPGTTATYRMRTGIPDSRSFGLTFSVRLRINSFVYSPNVDTGVYVGFLSNAGPGVAAAIGFDALDNIPYVKIQDVNANVAVLRVPFDWDDGNFHTYTIVRDPLTDSLSLSVD